MPGLLVNLGGILTCPHAAPVKPNPAGPPRVFVNGAQVVYTMADLHTVTGCPFQIPTPAGPKPQPCVLVKLQPSLRVKINGVPAALLTPAAICQSIEQIPQGPPNSAPNQKRVVAQ
jgi:hypothetical protein